MSDPAWDYTVHHLFHAAIQAGWTMVGHRLPGAYDISWLLPSDSKPIFWSQQKGPGFLLAPFSFPTTPAHWIAHDISFKGFHGIGDGWKNLPEPLRSVLQTVDATAPLQSAIHPIDYSTSLQSAIESNDSPFPSKKGQYEAVLNEVGRPEFELQIRSALKEIEKGRIEKVVLARSEAQLWPEQLHPIDFVERLCNDYPQAFVNFVLHPEWGLWIGASPELLLELEPAHDRDPASTEPHHWRRLRSMALAGTLPSHGQAEAWGDKEIREQQVVDDYIAQSWKNRVRNFRRSERNSIQAGPVQHLCTQLEGESNRPLEELVVQLHPTPAVGGWPKAEALQVISEIEGGSRQLYGGFLGPIASPDEARLFVNLRTLQLHETQAHVHMGCGILGGSQPHLEWEETVHKSKTLLRHLLPQNPMDASAVD